MNDTIISSISSILEVLIATFGFVLAVKEYFKEKRRKAIRMFVEQITAYYSEEQEAIKWIENLSSTKIPNLQQKLRNRAVGNENNPLRIYPKLTPKQAESYLC